MRLTVLSDYSLRVLMYLGAMPERLATIQEIARAYRISENHLMKVVHSLARHGFVETVRGRGGGMRLANPPEQITIGAVLRAIEDDFALVECFRSDNTCRITDFCRLKRALHQALSAYFQVLDNWTLAELVAKPKGLQNELGLRSPK
jgi:Rrf2 family nitric oxide-sensitive transcriptional repressor